MNGISYERDSADECLSVTSMWMTLFVFELFLRAPAEDHDTEHIILGEVERAVFAVAHSIRGIDNRLEDWRQSFRPRDRMKDVADRALAFARARELRSDVYASHCLELSMSQPDTEDSRQMLGA